MDFWRISLWLGSGIGLRKSNTLILYQAYRAVTTVELIELSGMSLVTNIQLVQAMNYSTNRTYSTADSLPILAKERARIEEMITIMSERGKWTRRWSGHIKILHMNLTEYWHIQCWFVWPLHILFIHRSLPRVINFNSSAASTEILHHTQYEELGFSQLTQMKMIMWPILAKSHILIWENVLFELGSDRAKQNKIITALYFAVRWVKQVHISHTGKVSICLTTSILQLDHNAPHTCNHNALRHLFHNDMFGKKLLLLQRKEASYS